MTDTIKRLEENIAILDYDIKELTDLITRYAKCKSPNLVQVAYNLRDSRDVLGRKRSDLSRRLHSLVVQDDFLQDYIEIA